MFQILQNIALHIIGFQYSQNNDFDLDLIEYLKLLVEHTALVQISSHPSKALHSKIELECLSWNWSRNEFFLRFLKLDFNVIFLENLE